MDARAVMALVENLVDGPASDQARVQANLRYILEALEGVQVRHRAPKERLQDEELRQIFLRHLNGLYQGLAELEQALLSQDGERLRLCLEQIREAATGLQSLEERIEMETEVSHETL